MGARNIKKPYYSTDITKGALMLPESRAVARVLIQYPDMASAEWEEQVVRENVLQKRSPVTARSRARYLRARLLSGPRTLLPLVADGDPEVATQAAMALAIKHSRLLGDYMDQTLRMQALRRSVQLKPKDWTAFLENAEGYAPDIEKWSDATRQKMGQIVHLALTECGYLSNTRDKEIRSVRLRPELRRVLSEANEDYVLRCMEVTEG
jgi:hypothetical protein